MDAISAQLCCANCGCQFTIQGGPIDTGAPQFDFGDTPEPAGQNRRLLLPATAIAVGCSCVLTCLFAAVFSARDPATAIGDGPRHEEWIDVAAKGSGIANPARIGDVAVWVDQAKLENTIWVGKETGQPWASSNKQELQIWMGIENTSKTKRLTYSGFRRMRGAALSDNFGNRYPSSSSRWFEKPAGQEDGEQTLYPGKSELDVLVFEKPLDNASFLYLEIPAKSFGGSGTLKFKIQASRIKR